MSVAAFLREVVESQAIDADETPALDAAFSRVRAQLVASFPEIDVRIAGSLAKGTAIRAGHDLDIVGYFGNDDATAGRTLEAIYDATAAVLDQSYRIAKRRSSIRLSAPRVGTLPFTIDVVPGRFVDTTRTDVFLHQTTGTKERLKTNLDAHVQHVSQSGVVDAIRLAKLWKLRAGIDTPTFVLELLCIAALREHVGAPLDEQITTFWTALRDRMDDLAIEDPANPTGNDLTDVLDECAEDLTSAASVALDLAGEGDWETIFGANDTATDRAVLAPKQLLRLGDTSHARNAPWPVRRSAASVRIVASARKKFLWRLGDRWRGLPPDGPALVEGSDLRFHAHVQNVPVPYEIKWQVVNTGDHAEQVDGGLRGVEFFKARSLEDRSVLSSDQHITYEHAGYTGKHWIECFVVKNGELWARSGRFYVNVINRSHRSSWYLR